MDKAIFLRGVVMNFAPLFSFGQFSNNEPSLSKKRAVLLTVQIFRGKLRESCPSKRRNLLGGVGRRGVSRPDLYSIQSPGLFIKENPCPSVFNAFKTGTTIL